MRDSRGLVYSTTLHIAFVLLLVFGLPSFFHRPTEIEPESYSVEIVQVSEHANIKPQEEAPKEETKKPIAEKNTEKKAAPETKKAEEKKEEKAEVTLPDKKKPEKKKPEKKKPEKKTEDDPLKAVLNDVKAHAKIEESEHPTQQKAAPDVHKAVSQSYDPGAPLSNDEKGAIIQQISDKWIAPVGAKETVNVSLHIELNPDGSLGTVEFTGDKSKYSSDSYFRAAVDAALRAVHQACPLKNMPADKYNVRDGWKEMDVDFTPPEM